MLYNRRTLLLDIVIYLNLSLLIFLSLIRVLSPFSWAVIGTTILIFSSFRIYQSSQGRSSLLLILLIQITFRALLHFRTYLFLFHLDETYQYGLALLFAFYDNYQPVERMIGYADFPLLALIASFLLKAFGERATIISIKIIYCLGFGILTTIIIDKIYFELLPKTKARMATYITALGYRFLYFSSHYIYETATFFFFTFSVYLLVKIFKNDKKTKSKVKNDLLLYMTFLLCIFVMGLWHYFSFYLFQFLFSLYILLIPYALKKRFRLKLFVLLIFSGVGHLPLFILPKAHIMVSLYFRSAIPFLKFIPNFGSNSKIVNVPILFLIDIIGTFCVILFILIISKITDKLSQKANAGVIISNHTKIKLVLGISLVITFFTYIAYIHNIVPGLTTTEPLGVISFVAMFGVFMYVFSYLIFPLSDINKKRWHVLFWSTSFTFFLQIGVLMVNYILFSLQKQYAILSINLINHIIAELSFRLIPYFVFFATPPLIDSLLNHKENYNQEKLKKEDKNKYSITTEKNLSIRTIKTKFRKLYSSKTFTIFFMFLVVTQSVAFIPWQSYTYQFEIPEGEIIQMSNWIRTNINDSETIFVEYFYKAIVAYSYKRTLNLGEKTAEFIVSLYYVRNITKAISILSEFNCQYFIYDTIGNDSHYNLKILRDKYLIALYNVDKDILTFYNDTLPDSNLIEIAFQTSNLYLFKII